MVKWLIPFRPFHDLPSTGNASQVTDETMVLFTFVLKLFLLHSSFPEAIKCSELHVNKPIVMNCSNPWGNFSYGSACTFHCPVGQSLNGSGRTACQENGHWSTTMPTCQGTFFTWFRKSSQYEKENQYSFTLYLSWLSSFLSLSFPLLDKGFTISRTQSACFMQSNRTKFSDSGYITAIPFRARICEMSSLAYL